MLTDNFIIYYALYRNANTNHKSEALQINKMCRYMNHHFIKSIDDFLYSMLLPSLVKK